MLSLDLNCPLVVLDVETTGTAVKVDRIVQIGLIKLYPDGRVTEWETLINPTVPIPPEVSEASHHITDEMVKDAPTFESIGPQLASGFRGCDFAGYNVRFDLDMFRAEFKRVRARADQIINGRILDSFKITQKYNPRDLSWTVERYTGKKLENAHNALADVRGTIAALAAQIAEHNLPNNMEDLHRIFFETPRDNCVDADAKLVYKHGKVTINFGKHAGRTVESMDAGYLKWVINGDFTPVVKDYIREELKRRQAS